MAKRRRRRSPATRRRRHTPMRARSHRTVHHRRRSTRRRRNPSFDLVGTLIAGLGGGALGGARYALDMTSLSPNILAAVTAAGGLALGAGVSGFSRAAGAGIAGAGVGIAALELLRHFVSQPAQEAPPAGGTPSGAPPKQMQGIVYNYLPAPQLGRVTAQVGPNWQQQLGAIRANLG